MKSTYDIAVIGSGFAGSLFATIARRLGRSVVLLESGRHPRFAIGESSTPLANLLLEELTRRYGLPNIAPLAKWGTWQATHPELACGLKRGFSFFHHVLGQPMNPARENQLLVAASPHDRIADVHWYRADFDAFLVQEAQSQGVEFLDQVTLHKAEQAADEMQLRGTRDGAELDIRAGFVVDATGPRGFLHKALGLSEKDLPAFPGTQALYTHFTGVRPFAACAEFESQEPPYPVDDAAVHHVFDGGWIWVLHFNNGVTSAGVAALDQVADRLRFAEGAGAWDRLLRALPSVQKQFTEAQPQRPFVHAPKISFRTESIAGKRWAMLPSAAGFADPLLSTGFPLTLLGVTRLASILENEWNSQSFGPSLRSYAEQTDRELLAASHLISGLYASMDNFPLFSKLSLLYFAAASFSETARRLGKPELASSFLLHDNPVFGPSTRELLDRVIASAGAEDGEALKHAVLSIIEPIDVAGLSNPARNNWYPVDADDLLNAAVKVQSNRNEISSLLERSGFWEHHA